MDILEAKRAGYKSGCKITMHRTWISLDHRKEGEPGKVYIGILDSDITEGKPVRLKDPGNGFKTLPILYAKLKPDGRLRIRTEGSGYILQITK